jgi:hypothetical protein
MKKIYRKIILTIFQTTFFSYIILKIIPYIRFNFYYTNFPGWKYKRGYRLLKPGDIILTKDKWKLTSMLIPGEFCHAALCVDKSISTEFEVAEMTHTHFTKSNFYDICRQSTRVKIIRCKDWDEEYIQKVIEKCKSFENTEYDVTFSLNIKTLYCSELVNESDFENKLDISYSDILGLGMPYISPTGLSRAKNIKTIWDSNLESNKSVEKWGD